MPLVVDREPQTGQDWDSLFEEWRACQADRGECYIAVDQAEVFHVIALPAEDVPPGIDFLIRSWRPHPTYDRLAVRPPGDADAADYARWFARDLKGAWAGANRIEYTPA